MNTQKLLLASLLALAFAPAMADEAADEPVVHKEVRIHQIDIGNHESRAHPRVVKNAPYSAESVTESVQNLADGNQIANRHSTMNYRDSAGRTRQEVRDDKGEGLVVTIRDGGTTIILKPADKTAVKFSMDQISAQAGEMARAKIEQMRKDGKLPDSTIVKRVERVDGEAGKNIREEVRIRVAERLDERKMGEHVSALVAGAMGDMKWSGKSVAKDLGTRDFEGVKAEGKQRSFEIPAGAMGNKNAITVTDETWVSPELHVTVYSKHSDPRSGDRIFHLANLKREEPAASLFTIPSDYTVKDALEQMRARVMVEKK
ncbi:MAG: hypothetical protein V4463_13735 [Pseudomonadota bacterium]